MDEGQPMNGQGDLGGGDLYRDLLRAIGEVAQRHGLHDTPSSDHAIRLLVDAIGRVAFAIAFGVDPKVSAVLVHATKCGSVVVSVRRGANEYHEVVIGE
jgi:hypothetical protein